MARRTQWFSTSAVDPKLLGDPNWAMASDMTAIHAKEVGTALTACGRHATTWHKHWTPFETSPPARRCQHCAAVVIEAGPAVRDNSSDRASC